MPILFANTPEEFTNSLPSSNLNFFDFTVSFPNNSVRDLEHKNGNESMQVPAIYCRSILARSCPKRDPTDTRVVQTLTSIISLTEREN